MAYPTETFYGLGTRISDSRGLERIVRIKGREAAKGMIVLAASMDEILSFAHMDKRQRALLERFWPGPVSGVLMAAPGLHPLLSPEGRVAVRISPNPLALALTREAGPITSTSANPSGKTPATTPEEVAAWGLDMDAILDGGKTTGGKPSTLIDLTTWPPLCLREGILPFSEIVKAI